MSLHTRDDGQDSPAGRAWLRSRGKKPGDTPLGRHGPQRRDCRAVPAIAVPPALQFRGFFFLAHGFSARRE
jgi:hypothetical protein